MNSLRELSFRDGKQPGRLLTGLQVTAFQIAGLKRLQMNKKFFINYWIQKAYLCFQVFTLYPEML